jgi:hypothetical protein
MTTDCQQTVNTYTLTEIKQFQATCKELSTQRRIVSKLGLCDALDKLLPTENWLPYYLMGDLGSRDYDFGPNGKETEERMMALAALIAIPAKDLLKIANSKDC